MAGELKILKEASESSVEALQKDIERKYPVDLYLSYRAKTDIITIGHIIIDEGERGSGIGTKIMEEIIDFSDKNGIDLALTPDTAYGASSVSRLKKFYKSFGFVENKGRNKDYRVMESMIRSAQ
jgi:predicted GNAT family N-acyltransferase